MVHISADLICKLEKAVRWPARSLINRCDAVLDTGGLLERLLGLAEQYRATDTTPASVQGPAGTPIPVVVVVGREILPGLLLRHVALPIAGTVDTYAQE
jgi:hypothetical protein